MTPRLLLAAFATIIALGASAKTKMMFFFDTEDFTCDESNDAILETAKILSEEGVVGEYAVVGYLAREIVRNRRQDVIDALSKHHIGSQSLGHSVHPTIVELSDRRDFTKAYKDVAAAESEGFGMLKAAFGLQNIDYAVPPGNSFSYVAMYAYADLGAKFYAAGGFTDYRPEWDGYGSCGVVRRDNIGLGLWYCNLYQIPYNWIMTLEDLIPGNTVPAPNINEKLDLMSKRDLIAIFMHPNMAVKVDQWDGVNYARTNLSEYGKWVQVPNRPKATVEGFYRNFRNFVRRVKADDRFEITDLKKLEATLKPRRAITRSDLAGILASLKADFGPVHEPASWSLADIYQALVKFLRDDGIDTHTPGIVHGFLETPAGVRSPTQVNIRELRWAASKLDLDGFIPHEIEVASGRHIGPADFLYAGLEMLSRNVEVVTAHPREQLGSFKEIPDLEQFQLKGSNQGGWIIHSPDYNDEYLSRRLRLQLWTMRIE